MFTRKTRQAVAMTSQPGLRKAGLVPRSPAALTRGSDSLSSSGKIIDRLSYLEKASLGIVA
jgi:hypothetical protein